jgi:hypothetical protein
LLGYAVPAVRHIETLLPDYAPVAQTAEPPVAEEPVLASM